MQTLTPEELHQQYTQTVAAYGALLPEPALRVAFAHQVDGYFRQYLLALPTSSPCSCCCLPPPTAG